MLESSVSYSGVKVLHALYISLVSQNAPLLLRYSVCFLKHILEVEPYLQALC